MYQRDRRVESLSNTSHKTDEASKEPLANEDFEWHPFKVWRTRVLRSEDTHEDSKRVIKKVSSF